jgi:hypothetical protein
MAIAYHKVHGVATFLVNLPSAPYELIREFSECDHRNALYIRPTGWDATSFYETSYLGCLGISRSPGALVLFEIRRDFDRFDHALFMKVRKHVLTSSILH